MKKLWLILLLVFSPSLLFAWGVMGVSGGVVANGGSSYSFKWDGDNASGTGYAEINGTVTNYTSLTGVEFSTSYGQTGYGAKLDNSVDSVLWAISESATKGTIWVSIKGITAVTSRGTICSASDTDDDLYIAIDSGTDLAYSYYQAQINFDPTTFTTGAWVRVGYTWDTVAGKHKIVVVSTDWADGDEDTETLTALGTLTVFSLGKYMVSNALNRETYVDDIYFINGIYEAADPLQ